MISYLKGNITVLEPTFAIVECNGIGYEVKISLITFQLLRDQPNGQVFTYFQVREDAHILYGFYSIEERRIFELLLSVSGVGGNTALMVLSSISVQEIQDAIASENVKLLQSIKGIGAKTAGRIILELKDKVSSTGGVSLTGNVTSASPKSQLKSDALAALVSLGFPKALMEKKLDEILNHQASPEKVEDLIKAALRGN